jgi:Fic family protein
MTATADQHHAPPRLVDFDRLLAIVRGEYLEMPGLRLTRPQAQRLWALDVDTCDAVLTTLEEGGFLRRSHGGDYVLAVPH